jgi:hypothetical protein
LRARECRKDQTKKVSALSGPASER